MRPTEEIKVGGRVVPTARFRGASSISVKARGRVAPYVVLNTGSSTIFPFEKSDFVPGATFTGNPKTFAVLFTTPYPTTNYSISISCTEGRLWVPENVTPTGFTINSQANAPLVGTVYWSTIYQGESD